MEPALSDAFSPYDIYWPCIIGLAATLTLVVITLKWDRMYINSRGRK